MNSSLTCNIYCIIIKPLGCYKNVTDYKHNSLHYHSHCLYNTLPMSLETGILPHPYRHYRIAFLLIFSFTPPYFIEVPVPSQER